MHTLGTCMQLGGEHQFTSYLSDPLIVVSEQNLRFKSAVLIDVVNAFYNIQYFVRFIMIFFFDTEGWQELILYFCYLTKKCLFYQLAITAIDIRYKELGALCNIFASLFQQSFNIYVIAWVTQLVFICRTKTPKLIQVRAYELV